MSSPLTLPQTFVGNGEMSHKLNERFLAVWDEYFASDHL